MKVSRFVVTGAAGFIGSTLVDFLVNAGKVVLAMDSFTPYYSRSLKLRNSRGFALNELDLKSCHLPSILEADDIVIHLAGQPGVRSSFGASFAVYVQENVLATSRLLEACADVGVGRFILGSTSSVYGDVLYQSSREVDLPRPVSPYGVTKLASEHLVRLFERNFSLRTVVLRFFTVYGPRQRPDMAFSRIISSGLQGVPFSLNGDGSQLRDFTFVDDVVSAIVACTETDSVLGKTLNVGGGEITSLARAIDVVGEVLGEQIRLDLNPMPPGEPHRTSADTSELRRLTGWEPAVGFETGLIKQIEWGSLNRGS